MGRLRQELASGVFYLAVAKYSGLAVQLLVTAVLARLLTPADFGVVAVATVIIAFFNILSDIGIGPAIIQDKSLTDHDLSHIFSFTLYTGLALSAGFFLCAEPIAAYYDNGALASVCRWLSLPILFYSLNVVPLNIQYKEKRFRFIAFATLGVQATAGVCSVWGAAGGMGLYALVMSQVLSSVLLFCIFYLRHALRLHGLTDLRPLRKIMSFSIYQFLFNLINYFSRNLDKLLIGRFIGMSSLGYYEKSYRLMLLPLQNITFVISPAMQPVLSTLQHDLRGLAVRYLKVLRLLAYISFPLSAFLYSAAEEIIVLFFGSQWMEAAGVFRILALTVSVQMLTSTSGAVYQSANATRQLFVSGCWGASFMIAGFCVAICCWGSIVAVAYGFLVAQCANTVQCFILLFKTLGHPIASMLRILARPFMAGCALLALLLAAEPLLPSCGPLPSLSLKLSVSAIVALLSMRLLGGYDLLRYLSSGKW